MESTITDFTSSNNLCKMDLVQTFSMPQVVCPTVSKVTHSLENVSDPKPRYIPIVPKQSPPSNDRLNNAVSTKSSNRAISPKSCTVTRNSIEYGTKHQGPSKREGEGARKKYTKSNNIQKLTNTSKPLPERKERNSNLDKLCAPVPILPKPDVEDSMALKTTSGETKLVSALSEHAPQISILDEAMEVCGILNDSSGAEDMMVDGVMPLKGSVLKKAMQIKIDDVYPQVQQGTLVGSQRDNPELSVNESVISEQTYAPENEKSITSFGNLNCPIVGIEQGKQNNCIYT